MKLLQGFFLFVFFTQNLFLLDKMKKKWIKLVLSTFFCPKLSQMTQIVWNCEQFGPNGHFIELLHFNRSRAKHYIIASAPKISHCILVLLKCLY